MKRKALPDPQMLTQQTSRDKDRLDRLILERALDAGKNS